MAENLYTIEILGPRPDMVPALEGATVLESLLHAGLGFPYSCQQGNCGTCKCELVQGEVTELPHTTFALSATERARNLILACRAQVRGDCVICPLDAEEFVVHPPRSLHCRVRSVTDLTHDTKELELVVDSGGPFDFSPGQYAKVSFTAGAGRDYSMACVPEAVFLQFHVRRVPGGSSTAYLFECLQVGDPVEVEGPFGTAYLREQHTGPILGIAGGSGLAPIKAIVESALLQDAGREIHLYFGVREERDVYLETHLQELARQCPNFHWHVVLSDAVGATSRRTGLVTTAVAQDLTRLDGFKAYLAGPPPMVEAAQRYLLGAGLPQRDVHADAFYTAADRGNR